MSWLDNVGKKAMDVVDKASRAADDARSRVEPFLDKTPLASKRQAESSDFEVPEPDPNESPFEEQQPEEEETPYGDPSKAAEVFGPGTDPWTGRVLQLLADHDVEHDFVDLESEGNEKVEPKLVRETKQNTPPYVFLRGELIGGYNALNEIVRLGQLEVMTTPPEEREESGGLRIVIPKRNDEDEAAPGERGMPDDRK